VPESTLIPFKFEASKTYEYDGSEKTYDICEKLGKDYGNLCEDSVSSSCLLLSSPCMDCCSYITYRYKIGATAMHWCRLLKYRYHVPSKFNHSYWYGTHNLIIKKLQDFKGICIWTVLDWRFRWRTVFSIDSAVKPAVEKNTHPNLTQKVIKTWLNCKGQSIQ
jgi:hypothetical protein